MANAPALTDTEKRRILELALDPTRSLGSIAKETSRGISTVRKLIAGDPSVQRARAQANRDRLPREALEARVSRLAEVRSELKVAWAELALDTLHAIAEARPVEVNTWAWGNLERAITPPTPSDVRNLSVVAAVATDKLLKLEGLDDEAGETAKAAVIQLAGRIRRAAAS